MFKSLGFANLALTTSLEKCHYTAYTEAEPPIWQTAFLAQKLMVVLDVGRDLDAAAASRPASARLSRLQLLVRAV